MSGSTRNSSLCKCGISSTVSPANDIQLAQSPYPTAKGLSSLCYKLSHGSCLPRNLFSLCSPPSEVSSAASHSHPAFPLRIPDCYRRLIKPLWAGKGSLNSRVDGRVLRRLSIILGKSNKHQMLQLPYDRVIFHKSVN